MILELVAITLGILISFFLKDINFLAVNLDFFNTGLIYPDFLLIFLIFFALNRGEFSGLWIGFFSGLLEDSGLIRFSDAAGEFVPIIGVHALIYTLTGFTLGKMQRFLDRAHALPQIVLVFATTLVVRFITWLFMGVLDQFNFTYAFIGPAIFTAVLSPVWFLFLSWVYRVSAEEVR